VRQSFEEKMMQIKMANLEKEQLRSSYFEQNKSQKELHKQVINERV
jgi:hypothetical protein